MDKCKNCDTRLKLNLTAYIFMIISTVFLGILIIPLAWCIPMTIRTKRKVTNLNEDSIALGVCSLVFVNLISGILLLVSSFIKKCSCEKLSHQNQQLQS